MDITILDKVCSILAWIFYVLAAVAIALYFIFPENKALYFYAGCAAVFVYFVRFVLRKLN